MQMMFNLSNRQSNAHKELKNDGLFQNLHPGEQ